MSDFVCLFVFYSILCSGHTVENVRFAPNLSNVPKSQERETVLQEEF